MPTNLKRISCYADPELAGWLEAKSAETGATVSELVRRAIWSVMRVNKYRETLPPEKQWVNSLCVDDPKIFTQADADELRESVVLGMPNPDRPLRYTPAPVLVAKKETR